MDRRPTEAGGRGEEDPDQAVLLWGKVQQVNDAAESLTTGDWDGRPNH